MALRYKLVHHPLAAADYRGSLDYFVNVDEGLADLFKEDFKAALRGIATGRVAAPLPLVVLLLHCMQKDT